MITKYHINITREVFQKVFSNDALNEIIRANIKQDRIIYQFGHNHYHFDGNAFVEGFGYIAKQKELIYKNINLGNYSEARTALGRLSHTWQDFYSHSNYVQLWLERFGINSSKIIDPDSLEIMNHNSLRSGKNYGLCEFIALLPVIGQIITPLMPEDSHAKMNLDSPRSGPLFDYVYVAAKKRTQMILIDLENQLSALDIFQKVQNRFYGHLKG